TSDRDRASRTARLGAAHRHACWACRKPERKASREERLSSGVIDNIAPDLFPERQNAGNRGLGSSGLGPRLVGARLVGFSGLGLSGLGSSAFRSSAFRARLFGPRRAETRAAGSIEKAADRLQELFLLEVELHEVAVGAEVHRVLFVFGFAE